MQTVNRWAIVVILLLSLPLITWAAGLDVEVKAGGGLAMGTTDDPDTTGKLRWAANAGLAADLYLLEIGGVQVGLSSGADYGLLNYHGITGIDTQAELGIPGGPVTERDSLASYQYLNIPLLLAARLRLTGGRVLTARAGTFFGWFLGGTTDLTYDPAVPPALEDGSVEMNGSNTEPWNVGLRVAVGLDLPLRETWSLHPELAFDMGLLDTSKPEPIKNAKDTFWALTANVGLKYRLF